MVNSNIKLIEYKGMNRKQIELKIADIDRLKEKKNFKPDMMDFFDYEIKEKE